MSSPAGSPDAGWSSDQERLTSFAAAVDAIRSRVEARIGPEDVRYLRRARAFGRAMEVVGRLLIHFSVEPVAFTVGVLALWVYRQLQVGEIGHTILHGCFDAVPEADGLRSTGYYWEVPVEESSWRHSHNSRHHQHTNVATRDPDLGSDFSRYTERLPHRWVHYVQVPVLLLLVVPNFGFLVGAHYSGLANLLRHGPPAHLADRSEEWLRSVRRRMFRKMLIHYGKEYVLFPLLAGSGFPRIMLGNFLSALLTNIYSAATNFSSHIGDDVKDWSPDKRPSNRGEFYQMQVEGTKNFNVPWVVSVLCGGLDRQIEHHLYPRLPPNRLRELGDEIKDVCAVHGVRYQTDTWPRTLWSVFRKLVRVSAPVAGRAATG